MITGSIGTIAFDKTDYLVKNDAKSARSMFFLQTVQLNAHEHAQVIVTFTGAGSFGWNFGIAQGDASVLGLNKGTVASTWTNTYAYQTLVRANSTGLVMLSLSASGTSTVCNVTDVAMLVKVIARET
jgi:hypothetical protein